MIFRCQKCKQRIDGPKFHKTCKVGGDGIFVDEDYCEECYLNRND